MSLVRFRLWAPVLPASSGLVVGEKPSGKAAKQTRYPIENAGHICGINSAVECHLAKVKVAGSNLVSRSKKAQQALFLHLAVHSAQQRSKGGKQV